MFFEWVVFCKKGDDLAAPPTGSSGNAVLVMAPWTLEHRMFVVEQFFRNGDSVITVQRLFRRQFNVEPRKPIPDRNTILRWIEAFRTTGSVMKRKPPGPPRTVRTPGNIEAVRMAYVPSIATSHSA